MSISLDREQKRAAWYKAEFLQRLEVINKMESDITTLTQQRDELLEALEMAAPYVPTDISPYPSDYSRIIALITKIKAAL